ncbi:hypothetical protein [Bradyrhizobium nitroreducens]|nr:hypothetical protein [Bradyrhizobium nitroreducens]
MTSTQQSKLSGLIIVPSQDVNPRSKNQSIANGGATGSRANFARNPF